MLSKRCKKWLIGLLVSTVFGSISGCSSCQFCRMPPVRPTVLANADAGVELQGGLPVVQLSGSGAEMGTQVGELLGAQSRKLLRLVRWSPQFKVSPTETARLAKRLAPEHLAELETMAKASGIERNHLIAANLALDSLCTVLVSGADGHSPLRVARNMDFFPAGILGPATALVARHPAGKHAFVAVTWPGYGGVITGMNDAGLTAAILQNYGSGKKSRDGTPIAFRTREILENSASLEAAATQFSAGAVASCHFLLLADAQNACVVWQDAQGNFHRHNPQNGWLAWSNGFPDAQEIQHDWRAIVLAKILATPPPGQITDLWLRQTISGVRLKTINAQAMLLTPGNLSLDLARARPFHAAATDSWLHLDLAKLLKARESAGDLVK